jgi:hypothetical protein
MRYLVLIGLLFFLFSCGSSADKKSTTTSDTLLSNINMHRLPELKTVDSIDMHFFPDIKDQKIYTRLGLNDSAAIQLFTREEINHAFMDNAACEYDTKFFCFSKGEIVKTLYVAALKDSCHFIGFIKSGGIAVKARLSDSAAAMINAWRKKAVR